LSVLKRIRQACDVDCAKDNLGAIHREYLDKVAPVARSAFVDRLHRKTMPGHRAVFNALLFGMANGQIKPEEYAIVCNAYRHSVTGFFAKAVLPAAKAAHSHPVWLAYIDRIIAEENHPRPHVELFDELMDSCRLGILSRGNAGAKFRGEQLAGYTAHDLPYAAGYALAVETEATVWIGAMFAGMRAVFPQADKAFFFECHLGDDQEEEHSRFSVELVESVATTRSELSRVRAGFLAFLAEDDRFMGDVYAAVMRRRR
jgi:hypothetical protein